MKKVFIIAIILLCIPISGLATDLKIVMTDPLPQADKITYTDDNISVMFYLNNKNGISFQLKNLTNKIIKIDWEQVSLIDLDQKTHRVLHSGILFTNRTEKQAPSIIPPIPNTKLSDTIFPVDYISYDYDFWAGYQWKIHDFITKKDANKTIGVFLPLEIDGTIKYYSFSFRIVKDIP